MLVDLKTVLQKILTIINYQGDKNKFITEFLYACFEQAVIELLESKSLPEKKRN